MAALRAACLPSWVAASAASSICYAAGVAYCSTYGPALTPLRRCEALTLLITAAAYKVGCIRAQEAGNAALKPLNLGRSLVDADAEDLDDDSEVTSQLRPLLAVCTLSGYQLSAWERQLSLPS